MASPAPPRIGFACAYTPLALIDAAGFAPYRLLPVSEAPDQAGSLLHDNLCPLVKRLLDRALAGDLPDLAGVVLVNSCDAMRRLAEAWSRARPQTPGFLMDLPVSEGEDADRYLAGELQRLAEALAAWGGRRVDEDAIRQGIAGYRELARRLADLAQAAAAGQMAWPALQALRNLSVTVPVEQALQEAERCRAAIGAASPKAGGVPVLLFGNVMPKPEAFELLEGCGVRIVADDLCTGSRQLTPLEPAPAPAPAGDLLPWLARQILRRPPCARTLGNQPGQIARQVLQLARSSGARGVIVHAMKFCDPTLARLPAVREILRGAGLPLLVLEGDCSQRSLGQQRTRLQAFAEMLAESLTQAQRGPAR